MARGAPAQAAVASPSTTAKPGELDESGLGHLLGYEVTRANTTCRRVFQKHVGAPMQLSPVEFSILVLVAHNRDVTSKRLGQTLAVSAPNLTALLDRLVERGLLVRVRNEADRRAQHLRLTRAGATLARQSREVSMTMEEELLRVLAPAERMMLFELLRKVATGRR